MAKDKITRIIALIGLCALVYYFSFDQGRTAQGPRLERLENALKAKERIIENMALEIRDLKEQLAECGASGRAVKTPEGDGKIDSRVTLRLQSSKMMFDQSLVLTCLDIDRGKKKARLQINLVKEDKLLTKDVGLGQSFRFNMSDEEYSMILEQIKSSFITVVFIKKKS